MTVLMAYPLSRTDFKAGGFIMVLCMITMYFSGGLIPTYLVRAQTGPDQQPLGGDSAGRDERV